MKLESILESACLHRLPANVEDPNHISYSHQGLGLHSQETNVKTIVRSGSLASGTVVPPTCSSPESLHGLLNDYLFRASFSHQCLFMNRAGRGSDHHSHAHRMRGEPPTGIELNFRYSEEKVEDIYEQTW